MPAPRTAPELDRNRVGAAARYARGAGGTEAARVLVVDDQAPLRLVLARIVRRAGHETREAATVSDALEAARAFRPHVVVVDLHLGCESGWALARALRRGRGVGPASAVSPRVVLMSGDPDAAAGDPLGLEVDGLLPKPFSHEAVLAAIEAVLSRTEASG